MLTEEEKKANKVEYDRNYYIKNKDKKLAQDKNNYLKNKASRLEASRKYYIKNWGAIRAKRKAYAKTNRVKLTAYSNKYQRQRYQTDLNFKLRTSLRVRVRLELKKHLVTKTQRSLEYASCSVKNLKEHIESQFEEGMTWDNWSSKGWHVDHIIPCSSFDLTKEKEQKKCFHYTNLQPLWAEDNFSKGNKLDWVKECA